MNLDRCLNRRQLLTRLSLSLLAPLSACGGGSGDRADMPPEVVFRADGLSGRIVGRLRSTPQGLIAGTDDGVFNRTESGWQPIGLSAAVVNDIVWMAQDHLLASVEFVVDQTLNHGLVETRDGGVRWHVVENDFGGGVGNNEAVHALVHDVFAGRLLATGSDVLAESRDHGRHWTLLAGAWQAFANRKDALAVDPARGDMWYGGQDAIEGLVLVRRRQADGRLDRYPGLLPSPSVSKGIRHVMGQPQRLLVSGEGGIVQTRDDGISWQTLLADDAHRFYFDVLHDVQRPRRFITAAWEKNFDQPQPLVLRVSDDDGLSWHRIEHPEPGLFGGVWSMALRIEGGRSIIYLGLYRGGVMRVELF